MTAADPLSRHQYHSSAPPNAVHDPVCGMTIDPAKARHRAEHAGHSYFFCGAKCREKFAAEPARYTLSPRAGAPKTGTRIGTSEVVWTCPMHPQILRNEPGSCPICGRALEPMTPSASDTANPELRDMTQRFWA